MAKNWINVGIVGCGHIYNDAHRNAYVSPLSKNNVAIAVCDLREDLAKDQFEFLKKNYEKLKEKAQKKNDTLQVEKYTFALENLKIYTDYDKMLTEMKGKLDLIDNCTQGNQHIPLSIKALENGCHAMSEKPPGLNFWDVRRIVEAEKRTGKHFQLSEQVCFERPVQKMRKLILEGKIGKITRLESHFGHNGPYIPYVLGKTGLPHFIDPTLSGGGCLQDLAPHGISRAFWPVGPGVRVVSCETKKLERRRNPLPMSGKDFVSPVDDWAEAVLELHDPRTNSNFTLIAETSWCGSFPHPCTILGENGELSIKKHLIRLSYEPCITDKNGKDTFFSLDKDEFDAHGQYIREIQCFCDKLLKGEESDTSGEYALRLQEILSIQYFSKLMKRKVTIEEMEKWAADIDKKVGGGQKAVDEIAAQLSATVDIPK